MVVFNACFTSAKSCVSVWWSAAHQGISPGAAFSSSMHSWQVVVSIWLQWLLLAAHAGLCPDTAFISKIPGTCQSLTKVCLDQNVYVLYDNQHNPRHELFREIPQLKLDNISIDYYGYSDVWGTRFPHPGPVLRPATGGEETRELAHPQFSRCSVPLVIYAGKLYMYGHFFTNTVAAIHVMQQSGLLDRRWVECLWASKMHYSHQQHSGLSTLTQIWCRY